MKSSTSPTVSRPVLHRIGVLSGLAAGAWLGGAEAPTKLVTQGFSPFLISLAMVAGVFTARWTVPMLLKGTGYVLRDIREKPHLIIWALLAGTLWAVANTLTVFAIRDVGLSIAFPLWNSNSLVGLFWGWLLFNELRGANRSTVAKVVGGAVLMIIGAILLAWATTHTGSVSPGRTGAGLAAALGAGLLWGSMYIPYRKAYLSGMNPLSFVTLFTIGELGTMGTLALYFLGGWDSLGAQLVSARGVLFWLFLGGFCWVLGDLFQQYAVKYVGIGRGIPLSNTNQLWGLLWGILVFGELVATPAALRLTLAGSTLMICGAVLVSMAKAPQGEQKSWRAARLRESVRYGLDAGKLESAYLGTSDVPERSGTRWWEVATMAVAVSLFVILAWQAEVPRIDMNFAWTIVIAVAMLAFLAGSGYFLWKHTRFS